MLCTAAQFLHMGILSDDVGVEMPTPQIVSVLPVLVEKVDTHNVEQGYRLPSYRRVSYVSYFLLRLLFIFNTATWAKGSTLAPSGVSGDLCLCPLLFRGGQYNE